MASAAGPSVNIFSRLLEAESTRVVFLVEDLAIGIESRQDRIKLGILRTAPRSRCGRFRLGRPADPLGVSPRLGQDFVVLPVGLAANHLWVLAIPADR